MDRPYTDARILLLDIETTPRKVFVWGHREQDVLEVEEESFMLSFAFKWLGKGSIVCRALPDYPGYKRRPHNDLALVTDLHKLLSEADIVVAHNGNSFDLKYANMRFLFHGLRQYPPLQTVDTLKLSRSRFRLPSHKLDHIAKYFGFGKKLVTTGKDLWLDCMAGKKAAWRIMREYNKHDVVLLEKFYLLARGWHKTHPRLTDFNRLPACPNCGSLNIARWGYFYTKTGRRQRFGCRECGHYFNSAKFIKEL